jgi:hypothetical protein
MATQPPLEHPGLALATDVEAALIRATTRPARRRTAPAVTPADEADAWWLGLTPERREQIHRWVNRPVGHEPMPGQLDALDHLTKEP